MQKPRSTTQDNQVKTHELGLKILESLRKITREIDLNSKKLSSENNLTAPQIITLKTAHDLGLITIAKMAQEVHLSSSTMVGIIDRLESKGLLSRVRSTEDRRQVLIQITEEGKKIANLSPTPLQEKLLQTLEKLSESEQKNMAIALGQLVEIFKSTED